LCHAKLAHGCWPAVFRYLRRSAIFADQPTDDASALDPAGDIDDTAGWCSGDSDHPLTEFAQPYARGDIGRQTQVMPVQDRAFSATVGRTGHDVRDVVTMSTRHRGAATSG
jgi:hypothetical protein